MSCKGNVIASFRLKFKRCVYTVFGKSLYFYFYSRSQSHKPALYRHFILKSNNKSLCSKNYSVLDGLRRYKLVLYYHFKFERNNKSFFSRNSCTQCLATCLLTCL